MGVVALIKLLVWLLAWSPWVILDPCLSAKGIQVSVRVPGWRFREMLWADSWAGMNVAVAGAHREGQTDRKAVQKEAFPEGSSRSLPVPGGKRLEEKRETGRPVLPKPGEVHHSRVYEFFQTDSDPPNERSADRSNAQGTGDDSEAVVTERVSCASDTRNTCMIVAAVFMLLIPLLILLVVYIKQRAMTAVASTTRTLPQDPDAPRSPAELSSDHTEEYTACKEKYKPGTAMEDLNGPFPDLTEEQQGVFQRSFTADAKYLENHEKMNQSFWESLVKCLATTDPPILNTEEQNNLLKSCNVLPGGCAACLKAIEKKGARAMAVLYLVLKTTNPSGYRQLPSSKEKDEKLKLLKRLERNLMLSQGAKKAESMDEDTQDSDEEDLGKQTTEGKLLGGKPAEVVPYRHSEITRREDSTVDSCENENTRFHQWTVRWMGIRKDDEFFHFVILCFAIGALLICYYYYKDWTISLGTGLITFASLETTGIYFGLVYRIRSVLDSFVPLIDKFRPTGMRKAA
ncbi:transmembrane protein 40 [Caloenas nicobarica]|uniref:transmembrane protein 40 n=1 Tax=Caloenas nicobarica TaxID=187106 RepID=UPI0032B82200